MKKYNKYIILSPHCDDAAFSLGASIIDSKFENILILTIFSKSTCTANNLNNEIEEVTKMRKKEDQAFFSSCKSEVELSYLDLLDAPIRLNIREEDVCSYIKMNSNKLLQNEIEHKIYNYLIDNSLILSPLGLGNHIDHLIVREIAFRLLKDNYNVGFYEDLPYAGTIPTTEIHSYINQLNKNEKLYLKPVLINSKMSIDIKAQACSKYSSQIDDYTINNIKKHHSQLIIQQVSERIWLQ